MTRDYYVAARYDSDDYACYKRGDFVKVGISGKVVEGTFIKTDWSCADGTTAQVRLLDSGKLVTVDAGHMEKA